MLAVLVCLCARLVLALPDLVVDADVLLASLRSATLANTDPCLVGEGCLLAAHADGHAFDDTRETRRLVRFSTRIWNFGTSDLHVGLPPPATSDNDAADEWWEYSACHAHYHLAGYALHELLHAENNSLVETVGGSKTGFCLRDNVCRQAAAPKYTCGNQGITRGCADHYGAELACQWVDVTDVRSGRYILRVTVNVARRLAESNYSNNVAIAEFELDTLQTYVPPETPYIIAGVLVCLLSSIACAWCCCYCRHSRRRNGRKY